MKRFLLFLAISVLGMAAWGQPSATSPQSGQQESKASAPELAARVDALEAQGKWREAIEPLQQLIAVEPGNAARLDQLGRWRSWQSGWREESLRLLRRACEIGADNPRYCTDYAEVLSWRTDTRQESIAELRKVITQTPSYTPAVIALANVLSWNRQTLPQARELLESALKSTPDDPALLVAYADVLASSHETRAQAMQSYDRALAMDPKNVGALTGKAQQLAWTGHSAEAMALYDRALGVDPTNTAALRGKAEILNWRGEYEQAAVLLRRAQETAPDDESVSAELARSQLKMRQYTAAKSTAAGLPANPEYRDVQEDIFRATGTWTEIGAGFRYNRQNLDYDRLYVIVSSPLGYDNRLTVRYSPTLYSTSSSGDFNSNDYGIDFATRVGDKIRMNFMAGANTYPGMSSEISAGAQVRYRANPSWEFKFSGERTPVDESYLSLRGVNLAGIEYGQVSANLGTVGFTYNNHKHGYDISAGYSDGAFTGRNLDPNRRWSIEGDAGKSFGGAPYFRIGYGVAYTSFDYNAEDPSAPVGQFGDYFSPQQFLLNYGSLTVSHKFNQKFEFDAVGTAGVQNVGSTTSNFGDPQFASSFAGHMLWRVRPADEVRIGYEYLNVYNAFHRNLPTVSYRHYF